MSHNELKARLIAPHVRILLLMQREFLTQLRIKSFESFAHCILLPRIHTKQGQQQRARPTPKKSDLSFSAPRRSISRKEDMITQPLISGLLSTQADISAESSFFRFPHRYELTSGRLNTFSCLARFTIYLGDPDSLHFVHEPSSLSCGHHILNICFFASSVSCRSHVQWWKSSVQFGSESSVSEPRTELRVRFRVFC